jgi:hypothetical protein
MVNRRSVGSNDMQDALAQAKQSLFNLPPDLQYQAIRNDWDRVHLLIAEPFEGCPINSLPIELLAYIFYLGTYAEDDEDDEDDEGGGGGEEDEEDEGGDEDKTRDHEDNDEGGDEESEWESIEGEDETSISQRKQSDLGGDVIDDTAQVAGIRFGVLNDSTLSNELPFPILVSHVCKHWRTVAIGSPALWTSISFTERPPFERCRTYIARSQNLDIDIHIDSSLSDDEDDEDDDGQSDLSQPALSVEDVSTILDIVIPHIERWRVFEVMVRTYEYMHLVLSRVSTECHSAPSLEVLQLYHYEDAGDSEYDHFEPANLNQSFVPFGGNAPKLRVVSLWGVHIDWSTPMLSDVIDLELAYHARDVRPSWEDFSRILKNSPKIETLTLCLSGPAGSLADWPETCVEIPSLQNLVLAYHEPAYVCSLIKLLYIPNVTSLALDFESDDYTNLAKALASPSCSSHDTGKSILANLNSLKLGGLPCDHKAVDRIYEQLGKLKSLNLNLAFLDKIFFRKLITPLDTTTATMTTTTARTVPSSKSIYCPLLESITTTGVDGWDMCQLVKQRKEYGAPIKQVSMSDDDHVKNWEVDWLKQNVESLTFFEMSDSETDLSDYEDLDGSDGDGSDGDGTVPFATI